MATDAPAGGAVAATWTTGQGEVLDWIVWKHYGRQDRLMVETVLAANYGLCELGPQLPEGLAILLPAIPRTPRQGKTLVRFWEGPVQPATTAAPPVRRDAVITFPT